MKNLFVQKSWILFIIVSFINPRPRELYVTLPTANGSTTKQRVDLPYDVVAETRETLTTTLAVGNLNEVDWVEVSFEDHDILCLEKLRLVDPSSDFALDIIQDYDPHAWNVNTEEQDWESATGRKITYFTTNCNEDWRMLSKASNFIASRPSKTLYFRPDHFNKHVILPIASVLKESMSVNRTNSMPVTRMLSVLTQDNHTPANASPATAAVVLFSIRKEKQALHV